MKLFLHVTFQTDYLVLQWTVLLHARVTRWVHFTRKLNKNNKYSLQVSVCTAHECTRLLSGFEIENMRLPTQSCECVCVRCACMQEVNCFIKGINFAYYIQQHLAPIWHACKCIVLVPTSSSSSSISFGFTSTTTIIIVCVCVRVVCLSCVCWRYTNIHFEHNNDVDYGS